MRFILSTGEAVKSCVNAVLQCNIKKPMVVTIKEYKKNRSTSQNAVYWMWLEVISKDTGFTKDELHDRFRLQLFSEIDDIDPTVERTVKYKIDGKIQDVTLTEITSSTELNTKQFTEYLQKIEILASSIDIVLPRPEDYYIAMGER